MQIVGDRIFLRLLAPIDVTVTYVDWMNDEKAMQFLESRFKKYNLDDIKKYVEQTNDGINNFMFGIFLKENDEHIGNIKIGGIDHIHRFANVGVLIGNKEMWGKGYGTEAIKLATEYAFNELDLHKLIAGIYSNNTGSYNAFMKAGYGEAGRLRNHRLYKERFVDEILVEIEKN